MILSLKILRERVLYNPSLAANVGVITTFLSFLPFHFIIINTSLLLQQIFQVKYIVKVRDIQYCLVR